jgi:hypothetical protein
VTMSRSSTGSDAWVTLLLVVTATVVAVYDLILLAVTAA